MNKAANFTKQRLYKTIRQILIIMFYISLIVLFLYGIDKADMSMRSVAFLQNLPVISIENTNQHYIISVLGLTLNINYGLIVSAYLSFRSGYAYLFIVTLIDFLSVPLSFVYKLYKLLLDILIIK